MFKLAKYLKGYYTISFVGAVCKLLEALFELIVPLVMAQIIDVGIANNDIKYILIMGGAMVGLGVLGLTLALTCQYLASKAAMGYGTTLRMTMYKHINSLSHSEIDNFGAGSLITRITGDINQTQTAMAMTIRLATRAPFLIIGATVMAMILDIKLSAVFLIIAPIVGIILWLIMSRSVPYYKRNQQKLDKLNTITSENLSGNRVIRAYAKQEYEIKRFDDCAEELRDNAVKVGKIASLLNPLTMVILNLAIVAIIWFGGVRVDAGSALTQGKVIAFVNYITQILLALVVFAQLVSIYTKAAASAQRINEVLATSSSIKDGELKPQDLKIDCSDNEKCDNGVLLRFDNVTFGYGGEPVISDINFTVRRGEMLGIIGGTGSGKSTLINLIPRFYDVSDGSVEFMGVNVKDYNVDDLRQAIGLVPQKAKLFRGTIAENIRWGKRNATDEEVRKAAKIAMADDFVMEKSDGYNTLVASNARNLSGGQIQRITIARALVRKPKLLILDDSSSALDYATDYKLKSSLRAISNETSTIIVSQRISSIKDCDTIILLDNGKAIAMGTHDELVTNSVEYREICASQAAIDGGAL